MGINTATLSGRVGKDPDLKYFESGKCRASFSLAVDAYSEGEKKTLWFLCEAWGKTAEVIGEYVKKGNLVTVSGSLDIANWVGADSAKVERTIINVRDIQLPKKGE